MAQNPNQELALKQGWHPSKPIDPDAMIGVNLKLPAPLHRQLRLKALVVDITLNEAIAQAVAEWVAK